MTKQKYNKKIIVFGSGGHAKSVANILFENNQYKIDFFVGKDPKQNNLFGINVIDEKVFFKESYKFMNIVIAIGDNYIREKIFKKIIKFYPKSNFPSIIHPRASISKNVNIGIGSVIMSNATINISSIIGKFCIINTSSTIEHECTLEDFVQIAPNACLGGTCYIGNKSFIGLGASVIHNVQIGNSIIIGAGSSVIENILLKNTYVGNPAKKIKNSAN